MIALLQYIGGNDFDDLQFQFHVIKTQAQGKVIGILTMHLGKLRLPSELPALEMPFRGQF